LAVPAEDTARDRDAAAQGEGRLGRHGVGLEVEAQQAVGVVPLPTGFAGFERLLAGFDVEIIR
jgi:hypothetical protein